MSPHAAGLVLLVEDERRLREPLEHLLRARSYDVITADAAGGAIELLERAQPDAAIVDLELRQGSGRDVVGRMPRQTPVIIFSALEPDAGDVSGVRPHTRYVEKPASLVWLVDRLDEMVREARAR